MLPHPKVKDRLSKLCVGLAAPCDPPGAEYDLQRFLQTKFPEAPLLPWVGFVTADLEWVGGLAGKMQIDAFEAVLAKAEASPLVPATPEAVKKLEAILAQAAKASERSDWKAVVAASKSANDVKGRTPVRDKLAEIVKKAREFAETELAAAVESARKGSDRAAVRTSLKKLSATFAGEPEQKDADAGLKALDKLGVIESLAAEQQDAAREKAAKDYATSRWVALFEEK